MKKNLLLLFSLFFSNLAYSADSPKLFIMLDVDNTITDRLENNDLIVKAKKSGHEIQQIVFEVKQIDQGFTYYNKNNPNKLENGLLLVRENLAIRPTLKNFLEEIIKNSKSHNIETHFLICSRKPDIRTYALINNLNYSVDGIVFKDLVDIVPRNNFREKIKLDGALTSTKSAKILREKYAGKFGPIKPKDFVILIDQLEDKRFIISDQQRDLNIIIPLFELANNNDLFNIAEDQKKLMSAAKKIKEFIQPSNIN